VYIVQGWYSEVVTAGKLFDNRLCFWV